MMKLPKPLMETIVKLSCYQAFYEKVCTVMQNPECTIEDIALIVEATDEALHNFKNTEEYKNALKGTK